MKHRRKILVALGALVLAALAIFSYLIWTEHEQAIASAQIRTRDYAAVLETRLDATLRRADAELRSLVRDLPRAALSKQAVARHADAINGDLDAQMVDFAELAGLRIFDRAGDQLYSSNRANTPLGNVVDRDYFVRLRDQAQDELVFSAVNISRTTGRPTMVVARGLRDGRGAFLGIVIASVELEYLQKLFQSLELGADGIVAVHRTDDFRRVVRWPVGDGKYNAPLPPDNPSRLLLSAGTRIATLAYASSTDGTVRIYSVHALKRYPFFISVGIAQAAALADWRAHVWRTAAAVILLVGLLIALLLVLWRAQARQGETTAALEHSEERWRLLFDRATEGILILSSTGKLVAVNAAFARMHGYSTAEMAGLRLQDLDTPEVRQMLPERMRRALAGEDLTFETEHYHKDGHTFAVEVSASLVVSNGEPLIQAFHRDISERKQAQAALRQSEERYRTAFQTSPDAINITRLADGMYLEVNQGFVRLTGWTRAEVIGRTSQELNFWHKSEDRERLVQALKQHNFCENIEVDFVAKDGRVISALMSAHIIQIDGVSCLLSVSRDVTERKESQQIIQGLAYSDTLTGLPNRRLLLDRLQQALVTSARRQRLGALLLVDLDDFKIINDTLGHQQGDRLLEQAARRLTSCVREGDTVARFGGDEFVVILEDLSQDAPEAAAQAQAVAEKIRSTLGQTYQLDSCTHHNSASIGVTLFGEHSESLDEPLKRADLAMYQAKLAGRNTLRFFDTGMQSEANSRDAIEAGLREALLKNQLVLHYAAQVRGQGQFTGAEALVRWQDPKRGLVLPAAFIPVAEKSGLIFGLGRWVLESACDQLAQWATQPALAHLTMAVNVSARQFHQSDFVAQVLGVLERSGARGELLMLELTESVLLANVEAVIGKMGELAARGIRFSLDDFGTGYSSLAYLKRLPLHQLKIGQNFVRDIVGDTDDAAIARMVIALGHSLNLDVIAEGVETPAQRDLLADLGCHACQGHFFAKPLPIDEFEAVVTYRA